MFPAPSCPAVLPSGSRCVRRGKDRRGGTGEGTTPSGREGTVFSAGTALNYQGTAVSHFSAGKTPFFLRERPVPREGKRTGRSEERRGAWLRRPFRRAARPCHGLRKRQLMIAVRRRHGRVRMICGRFVPAEGARCFVGSAFSRSCRAFVPTDGRRWCLRDPGRGGTGLRPWIRGFRRRGGFSRSGRI